jgi:two-component system, cell cycle sensor histidine kinase and response regulator CckA
MAGGAEVETDLLADRAELAARLAAVFGPTGDSLAAVERRAAELLPGRRVIVWEGDPQTFQFSYVSASAEAVLGYPAARWVSEPHFWAGTVVHPEDQSEAVAYCALATGQGRDHDFRYRAVTAHGRVVVLHDVVHVIKGRSGVAEVLRGVMIDVPETGPVAKPGTALPLLEQDSS